MKLYNGGLIITGIVIFLGLVFFPFYYNIGKVNAKPEPKLDTPVIKAWEAKYGKKECIESRHFMRREHMVLLNNWRDAVVRENNRQYRSETSGKQFKMSLQNECMNCHSSKKNFCDECHTYMSVKPFCWDCHIQPKEKEGSRS